MLKQLRSALACMLGFLKCWLGCHDWEESGVHKTGGVDYAETYQCYTCSRCRMPIITQAEAQDG